MARTILAISILAILFTSCERDADPKSSCVTNSNVLTLTHDNQIREYILHIPSSYDRTSQIPLMFNFHGFGGKASEYINYADMRALADLENFILVYPQGTCLDGSPHWNAGLPHPDNKSDTDDFGFIEALINELSSNYNIDNKRIYVCGYSNGAMFAYALGCYKSDLIAAIGAVSGTMLDTDCTPSHPMPVISIHGTSDNVLPYNGNSNYNSVEIVLNYWKNFNNTNTDPVVNSVNDNGTTIEHYAYKDGDNSSSVEHYKIIGGDHVWFNMNYQGDNTSELIWGFASRYNINGLR